MTEHYFGFQKVSDTEKTERVQTVFSSVAARYDLMNDLMSLGLHRRWKKRALRIAQIRPHDTVLDLAAGSGDLTIQMAKRVSEKGRVVAADLNHAMLQQARAHLFDHGLTQIPCIQANAENLPFNENSFDCITIAFGLRNVTNQEKALKSMHRVLKPGGRLVILEFSKLRTRLLQPIYDQYSFRWLPRLGQLVAQDKTSYQYLAESIRMHPDQDTLLSKMKSAGFDLCQYYNLSAGIVAIHRGYKQ